MARDAEVKSVTDERRNNLIYKLISFRSEAIKLTTLLESQSSPGESNQAAREVRASQYERLGGLRAQIEEIGTRLQYNLMD